MIPVYTIYVSPVAGSIACFNGLNGRIFRTCYANVCSYSANLHIAKSDLHHLEKNKKLLTGHQIKQNSPAQRKTTLKWNADGSLTSIDMTRILKSLEMKDLTSCELTCECDYS